MITLEIDNSKCQIHGLTSEQHRELKKILSYDISGPKAYYTGLFKSTKRYLIDKHGSFPTGLLYLVEEYLRNLNYSTLDRRMRPIPNPDLFKISLPFEPYPEQIEAATTCLREGRGIVCASTGLGKSVICALIIAKVQVRTLVVVPSLELKRQLTEFLKQTFGEHKAGPIKEGLDIAIENIDSLNDKCIKENGNYDCVIIDEFHHSGAKTYRKLNDKAWNKVYLKIGMTATPFRSKDTERLLLESVLSKVIYKIDYKMAVSKKYIVPMQAYFITLPKEKVKAENNWSSVYSELVVNNNHRNQVISALITKLHSFKLSTLCLVKEIKHGDNISKLCGVGFANGVDKDSDVLIKGFNTGKLTTLIGTVGVLGEGVDTKPAEWVLIAGLGKSKNQIMQMVGRAFRNYPGKQSCKIVIFNDPSHKWTKNHFAIQCKILLEEYGVKPVELKM